MSRYVELIEKVAAAINGGFTESEHAREKARTAIAAVAEWGHQNFYDDKPLHEFLGELSAALRAAAGSAPTPPEVK